MRKPYVTRSLLLAVLIVLGAVVPKAPDAEGKRNAQMGLEVSPVKVIPLDML